jgi:hypothetical protein
MTQPDDRQHTTEPAEGGDPPGSGQDTGVHPEEPAEGPDVGGGDTGQPGADTPDT